ncbi:MAG: HAD family hydrolase [Sedimentisphaerales bacterium]|nr:HAD family hydrolase [Sedimentisphaerales bacterium]
MKIKAVIFDMDGTITKPYFDFDAIREEIGLDQNSGPLLEAMQKMTSSERINAEKILHYHEQKAIEESQLNNCARETLAALRTEGIPIGILTRNTKANAYAVFNKHGLQFDAVVGREDGPVKPDAFGVLELCKKFNVQPHETLVVGDYLFDLLCAIAAGAVSVLLVNGKKYEFENIANYKIDNIRQVLDIIKQGVS